MATYVKKILTLFLGFLPLVFSVVSVLPQNMVTTNNLVFVNRALATEEPSEIIHNPVKSETFIALAFRVMKYLLGAIVGIALVFIMFGAVELMVSRGNQELLTRGKDTILWALIGLVAALLAFSLVAIVQNLIGFKFSGFALPPK